MKPHLGRAPAEWHAFIDPTTSPPVPTLAQSLDHSLSGQAPTAMSPAVANEQPAGDETVVPPNVTEPSLRHSKRQCRPPERLIKS